MNKNKYVNSITKFFDAYNGFSHYMWYDESDIAAQELPIICGNSTVGYVALNSRNIIFSVGVNTNLSRYSEQFEKEVSDKFMDELYKFDKDVKAAEELGVGSADLSRLEIRIIDCVTEDDSDPGQAADDIYSESMPDTHKVLSVNYAVNDVDSCSACYSMLIGALNRLQEDGLLEKLDEKIAIGQGYRGKTGRLGIGNCTRDFDINVPGCPPAEEDIYKTLKTIILKK